MALISVSLFVVIVLGTIIFFGVVLAFLGLGALFGTWFTSGGSHLDKKPTKEEMAEIFVPRKRDDPFNR